MCDLCSAIEVHKHRRRLAGLGCDVPGSQGSLALADGFQKEISGSEYMIDSWHKQRFLPFFVFHFFIMRGDRILIGEIRGAEAIDMLQALNTGHDGSLSTGHANTPQDMLSRIETMALMDFDMPLSAIRRQIASGIDLIVHLGRLRDKTRKVLQILEILGYDPQSGEIRTQVLYEFVEEGVDACGKVCGRLVARTGLRRREKLERAGLAL